MEIRPYENNAKKHPEKQLKALAKIVAEVGWRQPVLVNHETGVITVGHGRWMTYQRFKTSHNLKEIWVIDDKGKTVMGAPDDRPMTPEQEKTYRLADNKLNESDWDMGLVIPELKELSMEMVELTGFDKDLLIDPDEKDDIIPTVKFSKTKVGDLYELPMADGQYHRILCGDSTDEKTVAKLIGDHKVDMVFTDPPYGVNYSGQGKEWEVIKNDELKGDEFYNFISKAIFNLKNVIKSGAGCYVFHASTTAHLFKQALENNGFIIKNQLIWNKPGAGAGWGDYRWKHEPFYYCGLKGQSQVFYGDRKNWTVIDFTKTDDELANWAKMVKRAEARGKTTIWTLKRDNTADYVHPTQKPVELAGVGIHNSSKAGDIVLDLFLGSGSTLIASEKFNRICYGMELDEHYMDVIIQRWVDWTGTEKIKLNGEEIVWEKTPEMED